MIEFHDSKRLASGLFGLKDEQLDEVVGGGMGAGKVNVGDLWARSYDHHSTANASLATGAAKQGS